MKQELEQKDIAAFQEKVMSWWKKNARTLPWREDPSPYHVMISEVMLQQTQVNRVIPKYKQFLEKFPTFESLASAETRHLLQVWSGLGYNRRALWLKEAAKQVVDRGEFPQAVKELMQLKGIGPYTSRSILIFAFNSERELQAIADRVLLKGRSRDWHNALMDYGSQVMTANSTGISPTSRQACYEGSTRQVRGAVIRALTETDEVGLEELMLMIGCDLKRAEMEMIIAQLVADGLVEQAPSSNYRISR
ncbi:MAG: HhH-GPD family protein [Candidatus Thorarchaeota archaeon SMTZ1-45]|nr:MAG: hypothetical protein AM325_09850 [Candidatus Thorarchaeota archaeon SMTZ1-45]